MAANEARYAAQRAFGNTALVKEETRAVWTFTMFEQTVQDTRYALRGVRKSAALATVPFVFLTGYTPDALEERFSAVPILRKPVEKEALETALQTAVACGAKDKPLRARQ